MGKKISTYSMTGFAEATLPILDKGIIRIEIKSVNSRFLDINCKIPKVYQKWELDIKSLINKNITRGRVDLYVSRDLFQSQYKIGNINKDLFLSYFKGANNIINEYFSANKKEILPSVIASLFNRNELYSASLQESLFRGEKTIFFKTLKDAIARLKNVKAREGKKLKLDIKKRINILDRFIKNIKKERKSIEKKILQEYQDRIKRYLIHSGIEANMQRITQEAAIIAEKGDITEEIVRIESHLRYFNKLLNIHPWGRKADFLLQELLREVNTIGSKSQDINLKKLVINIKAELEKIKEQVQNIE